MNTNEGIIEDLRLMPVPTIWSNPLTWILIAVAAGILVYLLRKWIRSRPLPFKPQTRPIAGPPAHVVALNRLQELRARHSKLTAYQVALECSDILRRYIEARFQSPIRYQTTREFLGAVQANLELSVNSRVELGKFLEFFDGIKFARETAAPERTAAAIDDAEQFVRKCIPAEVALL